MNRTAWMLDKTKQHVMGIINLSPDSFATRGRCLTIDEVLNYAEQLVGEGVDIIDLGAEPTNPKQSIPCTDASEELKRLMPVIDAIRRRFDVTLSVDTSKPQVMREVVAAGVDMINDVRALRYPAALETMAELNVPVCLMHMQYPDGVPSTSAAKPTDIVLEVFEFLKARKKIALDFGINEHNIVLDPGFGAGSFGKNTKENLLLLKNLERFLELGSPLLIGVSRKTFIGDILNCPETERVFGSLALNVLACIKGATIIRTHDVRAMADAIALLRSIQECEHD